LFENLGKESIFKKQSSDNNESNGNTKTPLFNLTFGKTESGGGFFSEGSLFNNPSLQKGSSLFTNIGSQQTGFFSSLGQTNEGSDDEGGEGEGDEMFGKSNSPEAFKPTEAKPVNSDYERIYIKQIENFYTLSKEQNKFVSKGKGFVSLEHHKEKKTIYQVLFRNSLGVLLFNGLISKNIKKPEKISNNFKNIASFAAIDLNDEKKSLKFIKIPVRFIIFLIMMLNLDAYWRGDR
jgi:hypothetical protein